MKYTWRIIGHERLTRSLENDLSTDNLGHAYLFAGPEKVGKFTVAKTFAHILQCENNFCHTCKTCIQIDKNSHPDTIVFRDDGGSIGIDVIRELIMRLNMSAQSKYKIFIAENIERMTEEACNCLLKTLEEPPQNTIFLFTAIYLKRVLPTILSRVRILKFHHCPEGVLIERLAELYPETGEETIEQISKFSLGKPGVAFDLMNDPQLISYYKTLYSDLQRFLDHKGIFDRFMYVKETENQPRKVNDILDILTHIIRSRLMAGDGQPHYTKILDKIDYTKFLLEHNINSKLALENLMLNI
ncbi:DNA polymerase III subunit [Candidatus Peregrinibacteria bacterium]|nr:DNA polymerase III subunit [Candidatus Peregrinibacteria bacterium]